LTYNKGLTYGFLAGLSLIAVRLGYVEVTEEVMQFAQTLGTTFLFIAFLISGLRKLKHSSVFTPKIDGIFTGFSFAASLVSFFMYGISFP